ncbi:hypothetical protein FGB62_17g348 [Gracilaria domingensis]|nr:hypothetical protein FGB62_17g348 [Gracilaria domingensis]
MAFVSSFFGVASTRHVQLVSKNVLVTPNSTITASLSRRQVLKTLTAIPIVAGLLPLPAFADRTAVGARRSYDRYHPRILALIETMKQIRLYVTSDDVSGAAALITDKQFDVKGRRALSIYATGLSDNYVGQTSRDMLKYVDAFYKELAIVADGNNMVEHYGKAVDLLDAYYKEARLPPQELSGLAF